MEDLTALSSRIIDEQRLDLETNRITNQLSELAEDVAIIESFSHVVVFRTGEGLVLFDSSGKFTGRQVREALRRWSDLPVRAIVYTHGHIDHVGGAGAFVEEARAAGRRTPRIVGHAAVARRFARYRETNGYNLHVNRRQFSVELSQMPPDFLPPSTPAPDLTFETQLAFEEAGFAATLNHAKGETDDHTWAFVPAHRAICAGDFFIWNFPNAGNPQKVQRYPLEWAAALRQMSAAGPELFIPAHGLPIAGRERIQAALGDVASALEELVEGTLELMNEGLSLDAILQRVSVRPELMQKPYLQPRYDEPGFVVRNVWRQFGGWYDGNPSHLDPASDAALGVEIAALCGGVDKLVGRAEELAGAGQLELACHLIEMAVQAEPESRRAHGARFEIYRQRRKAAASLMSKGIFGTAARESWAIAHPGEPDPLTRHAGYQI